VLAQHRFKVFDNEFAGLLRAVPRAAAEQDTARFTVPDLAGNAVDHAAFEPHAARLRRRV